MLDAKSQCTGSYRGGAGPESPVLVCRWSIRTWGPILLLWGREGAVPGAVLACKAPFGFVDEHFIAYMLAIKPLKCGKIVLKFFLTTTVS